MDKSIYRYNSNSWQSSGLKKNTPVSNYSVYPYSDNFYVNSTEFQRQPSANEIQADYNVDVPISLAKSTEGKYFVGTADNLSYGDARHAWARLYNPDDSGVNLHVNVWTATDLSGIPFRVQIWFNSTPTGIIQESTSVASANTTISPLPQPKIKLQYAIGVRGFPSNGVKTFSRNGQPRTTINSEEEGKFIFPPGGSFLILLSNPAIPTELASGSIAFGWWEEPI